MSLCFDRVCIVGVGLLGGSIGLALRHAQAAHHIVGVGRVPEKLQMAQRLGAIDSYETDIATGAIDADLIIACTPVKTIPDTLRQGALAAPDAWLTDVGSTKQTIVEAVHSFGLQDRFIGSHPMAGSDKSGVQFADRDLFRAKTVILTPTELSHPDTRKTLEAFWQLLGAHTLCLDPAEHDRAVAQVSHLPHVVAAVLSRMTDRDLLPVAASGWASTTRVAAGDPELWRQILHENRFAIRESMRRFIDEWSRWEQCIESGDDAQLLLLLQEAQRIRSLSQFR